MSTMITGRISNGEYLELQTRSPDPTNSRWQEMIDNHYGAGSSDIAFIVVPDTNPAVKSINAGKEPTLEWSGSTITGVNFTAHDNKRWLHVLSVSKTEIAADDTETTEIVFQILKADKSGVQTGVNTSGVIEVDTPSGTRRVNLTFVNGECTINFKTLLPGYYKFPSSKLEHAQVRTDNQVIVDALLQV